jgi:hypothetical protein
VARWKRRRAAALLVVGGGILLSGCATEADVKSNQMLSDAITVERQAVACNHSIANQPRYQNLNSLIPLAAPYRASVTQMANSGRANDDDIRALIAWTQDMQKCRQQLIDYVRQSSPVSLSLILSAWAEEDAVFVSVIQRKLSWGAAATRLRAVQVKLLSELTDRSIQIDTQLNTAKQAALSRRVAIFDALTNLAP